MREHLTSKTTLMLRVSARRRSGALLHALATWRELHREVALMRRCVLRASSRVLVRSWRWWRSRRALLLDPLQTAARVWAHREVSCGLRSWLSFVAQQKQLARASRRWVRRELLSGVAQWRRAAKRATATLCVLRRACGAWRGDTLLQAMRTWKAATIGDAQQQQLLQRVLRRWARSELLLAFAQWCHAVQRATATRLAPSMRM